MKLFAPFAFLAGPVATSVAQDNFTVSVYVRGVQSKSHQCVLMCTCRIGSADHTQCASTVIT